MCTLCVEAQCFCALRIHRARPDIKAACHCHSLYGKAWSVFGKKVDILTQDACLFYDNQGVYENFGGIALSAQEGEQIAEALGPKHKTCILQNHGLLTSKQKCLVEPDFVANYVVDIIKSATL